MDPKSFSSLDICEMIYSSVLRGYNAAREGGTSPEIANEEEDEKENEDNINFTSPQPSTPSSTLAAQRRRYPPSSLNAESLSDIGSIGDDSPILRQSVYAFDDREDTSVRRQLVQEGRVGGHFRPISPATEVLTVKSGPKENLDVQFSPATIAHIPDFRCREERNSIEKRSASRLLFSMTSTTRSDPPRRKTEEQIAEESSSPATYDSNLPQESSSPCIDTAKSNRFLFSESESDFVVTESSNKVSVESSAALTKSNGSAGGYHGREHNNLTASKISLPTCDDSGSSKPQRRQTIDFPPDARSAVLTPRAPDYDVLSYDNVSHALANTSLSEAGESIPNEVSPTETLHQGKHYISEVWRVKDEGESPTQRALFARNSLSKSLALPDAAKGARKNSGTSSRIPNKIKPLAPGFKMTGFLRSPTRPIPSNEIDRTRSKPKRELFPADEVDETPLRPQIKLVDLSTSPVDPQTAAIDKSPPQNRHRSPPTRRHEHRNSQQLPIDIELMQATSETVELDDGSTYTLYPHQVQGIAWITSNFENRTGCILADDMGLGKTVQTAFFLRKVFASRQANWALILCPKSVTATWEDHLYKICPGIPSHLFYGHNRLRRLEKFRMSSKQGIVITTYDTFRSSSNDLLTCDHEGSEWDVWVADEATQMKNPAARVRKSAEGLVCHFALFLTGTPIMNNYDELWSLMDLAQPGILGCHAEFKSHYAILLDKKKWGTEARRDALATELRDRVSPFILRRTKEDIFSPPPSSDDAPKGSPSESATPILAAPDHPITLPSKTDIIVWQDLGRLQYTIYLAAKRRIDYKDRSKLLFNISYLKKLCRHPVLCLPMGRQQWRVLERIEPKPIVRDEDDIELMGTESMIDTEELHDEWSAIDAEIDQSSADDLRASCPKLTALYSLIPALLAGDHSILIFSESTSILDLIEKVVLAPLELSEMTRRIDGSVELKARARIMDDFNEDPRIRLMLLSTGAAALGLTLVKADRVVMMDPSWNPAKDAQAIDRAHRIGQQRSVMIFRFIMGGAIEDNMLRLQLLKLNLSSKILSGAAYKTWFTQEDLRDLFHLGNCETSKTRSVMRSLTENEAKLESDLGASLGGDPREILSCHGFAWMDDVMKDLEEDKNRKKLKKQQRCLV